MKLLVARVFALVVVSGLPAIARAQQTTVIKRRAETVFASLPFDPAQASSFSLSPDATRSGYVIPKDNGFRAVIDGNEGPPYDGIGRGGVVFSPDGHHTAYAALKNWKWRVVQDGAEGDPFDAVGDETITFSEQGWRLAYVAEQGGKVLVVADDKAGAPLERVVEGSLKFSPDGLHFAYVAAEGGKQFVVYDRVAGAAYESVGPLRFSHAGHFAYAASTADRSVILLDGGVFASREGRDAIRAASLTFHPDGNRLAFVAREKGREFVLFDGAEGKRHDRIFEDSITFSGDGARLAYVARRDGRARVVVAGAEVGAHEGVVPGSIRFAPAGPRVAYLVERAGPGGAVSRCAAVDGVEGKVYDWIGHAPVFSPDGAHVAFVAERRIADGSGYFSQLVVDGTESPSWYPWIRGDVSFRIDGIRVSYLAAAPDERFADAGLVPRVPGEPAAGARMVLQPKGPASPFAVRGPPNHGPAPVKLLLVQEDVFVY